ncbi:MAG: N(5)-(carboxyethyl)ornithine synthase [Lentisphaeria bacterium]|nr:N(5)-(carboxyethyl)ornithine synthase [Lentisphaeria bacterium]
MKLGLIKPNFPGERRVALLPADIRTPENELVVDDKFGETLGISADEYRRRGVQTASRQEVFAACDAIFSLKLIQPADYRYLRRGQMIIGWTHPHEEPSAEFMQIAKELSLTVVDIDNISPTVTFNGQTCKIPFIPRDFLWKNSFYAGVASVQHALLSWGKLPEPTTRVAVLSSGNVAQGGYWAISRFTSDIRMFYRKTMSEFLEELSSFDIVINDIETFPHCSHVISRDDLKRAKPGCLFIDASADAGGTIEGTRYTSLLNPVYWENGHCFYEVPNSPSFYFQTVSSYLSPILSHYFFMPDVRRFLDLRDWYCRTNFKSMKLTRRNVRQDPVHPEIFEHVSSI